MQAGLDAINILSCMVAEVTNSKTTGGQKEVMVSFFFNASPQKGISQLSRRCIR